MIATNRREAEFNHKRTLAVLLKSENVSEAAYLEAKRAHDVSIVELVSFERLNRTPKEIMRDENKLRLRNRGLDI